MAELVKTNESRSTSAEIQPLQSAENGTEEMGHWVCVLKQDTSATPARAFHES